MSERKDQPSESIVDEYATAVPEGGKAVVQPEPGSGKEAAEAERFECLTCGTVYEVDHGTCPNDGAPLRKIGAYSIPTGPKSVVGMKGDQSMIQSPASSGAETGEVEKPGTRGEEPWDAGTLQGERASSERPPGATSG